MTTPECTLAYRLLIQKHNMSPKVAVKAFQPDPGLDKVDTSVLYAQAYSYRVEQAVLDTACRFARYGSL